MLILFGFMTKIEIKGYFTLLAVVSFICVRLSRCSKSYLLTCLLTYL